MVFFESYLGANSLQEKVKHKNVKGLDKKEKSTSSTHDETTTKDHKSTSDPSPTSKPPTRPTTDKNQPTIAAFTSESPDPAAATSTGSVANVNALNNSTSTQSTGGPSASSIIGITFVVLIAVGIVGLFVRRKMVAGRAKNSANSDDKEWNAGSQDHADMRSVSQKTNSGFNDDVPLIDSNSKRPPSTTSPHAPHSTTSGSPSFTSTSMNNNDTYHSAPVAHLNSNNEPSLPQGWLKEPPASNKSPYYQQPNLNSSQNPVIASNQVYPGPSNDGLASSTIDVDDSFSAIPLDDNAAAPQAPRMSTVPQIPPLSLKGNKKDLIKPADQDRAIISERKDNTFHSRPESRPLGDLDDILSEFTYLDNGSHNINRIVDNKPAVINPNLTTQQSHHLSPGQPGPPSSIFVNNDASVNSGNVFSETEAANNADKNSSQSSPVVAGFVVTNKATMQVESVTPTSVEASTITGFVDANKSTIQVGNVVPINDEGDTVGAVTTVQTDPTQQSTAISGFVTANKSSIQVEDVANTVTSPDEPVTPMFDVERDTVGAVTAVQTDSTQQSTATSGFVTANKSSIKVEDVTNTPPAKSVTPVFDIEEVKRHAEKVRSMKTTTGLNKDEKTNSPQVNEQMNEEVNSNSAINNKSVGSSTLPSISVTPYDGHSPIIKSPIQFSEISVNQSSLELDDDVASLESPETDLTLENPKVDQELAPISEDEAKENAEDQVITSSRPASTLTDKHASTTSSTTEPKTYRSPTLSMFSLYDYEDRGSVSYTGGVTIVDGKTNEAIQDSEESLR